MRSEREIRAYRDDILAHTAKRRCLEPECENCRRIMILTKALAWTLGDSVPWIEEHLEAVAKDVHGDTR